MRIYVEGPQRIPFDESTNAGDQATIYYQGKDVIRAYTANQISYTTSARSLEALDFRNLTECLGRGEPGALDHCGRWLMGVVNYDGRVIGYYHGESKCNYPTTADFGIFWCESFDEGKTFQVPPDNLISYIGENPEESGRWGMGAFCVWVEGATVYMSVTEHSNEPQGRLKTIFMRSEDGFNFLKYDGNDFVGDPMQPMAGERIFATSVIWRNWHMLSVANDGSGTNIFRVNDFKREKIGRLLIAENDWLDREDGDKGDIIAYPSWSDLGGGRQCSNVALLHYTYTENNSTQRMMMRSRVRFTDSAEDSILLELGLFHKESEDGGPGDYWATTKYTGPGFKRTKILGSVFAEDSDSRKPLYDVYADGMDSHFLVTNFNPDAAQRLRLAGYIEQAPKGEATRSLIRHSHTGTHTYEVVDNWDGMGTRLGFVV